MFASFDVTLGNWQIKASSFDDQILIAGFNAVTVGCFFKMFYNEETAREFMENINDKSFKIEDWGRNCW